MISPTLAPQPISLYLSSPNPAPSPAPHHVVSLLLVHDATSLPHQHTPALIHTPIRGSQQQWDYNTTDGLISLRSDPSLCLSVAPGCPHHLAGCVALAECGQSQPPYGATSFDFLPASKSPGANHIITRSDKLCLEIDSHDAFQFAPLGVWDCAGAYDQANEWWRYEPAMGHLTSVQSSSTPGAFIVTACT